MLAITATDNLDLLEITNYIDFHSHILPGVDHGSSSMETTLFQLKSAKAAGVNRIISTSHFYPNAHNVESFLQKREKAFLKLLSCDEELPDVRLGAEVLICVGIENLPGIENLFIRGTRTLLLELPFVSSLDSSYYSTVERLLAKEIDVVIAHADRYNPAIVDKMISLGTRLQLNASSLVGFLRPKKHILNWINNKCVVGIGSDIHGADKNAYPIFVRGIKKLGAGFEYIHKESELIWNESFLK